MFWIAKQQQQKWTGVTRIDNEKIKNILKIDKFTQCVLETSFLLFSCSGYVRFSFFGCSKNLDMKFFQPEKERKIQAFKKPKRFREREKEREKGQKSFIHFFLGWFVDSHMVCLY